MFTDKAQEIIDVAKDYAFANAKPELDVISVLAAIGSDSEASVRMAECLTGGDVGALRAKCLELGHPPPCPGKLDLAEPLRKILIQAAELASATGVPDRTHPGLIDSGHLVCAMASSSEACQLLDGIAPITYQDAINALSNWYATIGLSGSITELVGNLRILRTELLSRVFGQDHAIHAFVEGLYNAEVTAVADASRNRPAALFVFAGPPGVGKTYLAELTASILRRPFKRFDMTGYTDHQQHNQLVGFAPSYQAAHPGQLTGFVEKNPNAFLLFDEIEKAHLNTIQLFYQILDAGRLEDKYYEKDASFRDTIIIFTTNAGRSLYDNPNRIGISAANSSYHKRTILSALENEKSATTGQPVFPQAICSRIAQGYPLMFNHLSINELERISAAELLRTEGLLQRQYFKDFSHDSLLPICLVLHEGGRVDARQLRSETEKFVKSELFKYCSLYEQASLENAFKEIDKIHFSLEIGAENTDAEIHALFEPPYKAKVLLLANTSFTELCRQHITQMEWFNASTTEEAISILSTEDIDIVLLDLWIRRDTGEADDMSYISKTMNQGYDFVPLSAHALDEGRKILEKIHERLPDIPIYLLSFGRPEEEPKKGQGAKDYEAALTVSFDATQNFRKETDIGEPQHKAIDDELFLACVRAGGARGLVATDFASSSGTGWETRRDRFIETLTEINLRLYREKRGRSFAQERKALLFDTAVDVDKAGRKLTIRSRNFRLVRAIEASDAGELVDEIRRPSTRFEDVIGAKSAKESLQFVIDWLKNPKTYAAMGVRPPKGILLGGPPGTGKTMLARAVAGESNCAFLETSATSFVTIWQGSGPQNVRNLFERARRYAPAIVFIDEIDAIGKERVGGAGAGRAEEETLNALLTEMDGFSAPTSQPVILLAATNMAEQLDTALKRRFDRVIEVDRPDRAARQKYLEKTLLERQKNKVTQKVMERIATQSAGMTIAELERIIHEASVMAAQRLAEITDEIIEEAFEKIRMGEATSTPDTETLRRIARHEAGHAFLQWLGGKPPLQVTIVGRGHAGGYVEKESDEERLIYTKGELEQSIRVSMGGRAAEILYYGAEEGLSTGVASDLQHATGLAQRMVREFGMAGDFGQLVLDNRHLFDGPMAIKVNKAAERIISRQLEIAVEQLGEHREYLDNLSEKLLEKNRLTREDLAEILPPGEAVKD